jgi:hypothetical protein
MGVEGNDSTMDIELIKLRQQLNAAYTELSRQRPVLKAVFDRDVWRDLDKWKLKHSEADHKRCDCDE